MWAICRRTSSCSRARWPRTSPAWARSTRKQWYAPPSRPARIELILRLPEGYETQIGDAGSALSGGQRQRIGLARALYGEPRLVVLDEPNANLDTEGETALAAALSALKERGCTVILIGHRPSMMTMVDKLGVLIDGALDGFGRPDAILAKYAPPRPAGAAPKAASG